MVKNSAKAFSHLFLFVNYAGKIVLIQINTCSVSSLFKALH